MPAPNGQCAKRMEALEHDRCSKSRALNQRWGGFSLGVSHCCASVFYLLVQIKVTKTKDTLSCADATHRCPARLRPQAGQPETRRATRDSDIRLSYPLAASTARRCAQGNLIQAARALLCRFRHPPDPTKTEPQAKKTGLSADVTLAMGLASVFEPVARRRRHGVATGVRRTAPVRTACLRIAKAIRVLYASRRRCVSE